MRCSRFEGQDDLVLIVRRVEALGKFLDTDDGKNLLAGTKRAANILRIEEKKDNTNYTGAPDAEAATAGRGKGTGHAPSALPRRRPIAAVAEEDFAAAMTAMAKLRPHVDAFFDKVTVNVDDKAVRENRLQAAQRNPGGHPGGGGFLQDRGVAELVMPGLCRASSHAGQLDRRSSRR